jgi:hypothetical protein
VKEQAMQWYTENVDIEKFRDAIIKGFNSVREYLEPEDENYIYWHRTIVSHHFGSDQTKAICDYFGIEYDKDDELESLLFDLDSFTDELASIINENLHNLGLVGNVCFGHHDDGDYGVYYIVSIEDVDFDEDRYPILTIKKTAP